MKHQTIYEINGADILAFGLDKELALVGAADQLEKDAEEYSWSQGYPNANGVHPKGVITEYIAQNLYSFADQWIKEGKPTMTQTQYYNN
jgi:hypothetical protein